jgi:hypothetical protein
MKSEKSVCMLVYVRGRERKRARERERERERGRERERREGAKKEGKLTVHFVR